MLVKVRHFVASRTNAPAVVVAVVFTLMALKCAVKKLLTHVFTLDHFVTTQRTMQWTKLLLDRDGRAAKSRDNVTRRSQAI